MLNYFISNILYLYVNIQKNIKLVDQNVGLNGPHWKKSIEKVRILRFYL